MARPAVSWFMRRSPHPAAPVILLVEDNATMRGLIRSLVEELASEIHECGDGEGAVALYPRLRPDWVLMDISMKGIGGIQATRDIRQMDPEARIVMVTEHGDRRHQDEARAAGACGFVLKEDLLSLPSLLQEQSDP